MADTIHIAGKPVNKKAVYVAGGVALVFGVFYYYQKRSAANSAAANSTANAANSQIDPQTGYPYGSPEDQAALAAMGGQYGAFDPGTGQYVGYDPYGGGNPGGGGPPPPPGPGSFTNNAQWATYAEQQMGSSGTDSIAAALGHYLSGAKVTSGEQTLIQEAIAIAGQPPVAGTNPAGYPPAINLGVGGPPPVDKLPVPDVVGLETGAATRAIRSVGLVSSHKALKPGVGSTVTSQSPKASTMVKKGSTVNLTIKEK